MPSARHATRADTTALAGVLAAAFSTDPLWRWITPDEARWERRAAAMFEGEVDGRLRQGHTYTTDDRAGVALWAPPSLWRMSRAQVAREAPAMALLAGVGGARRGIALLQATEKAHPKTPHWYLAVLGTHPDHQGRGVASALLEPVLARCDLDGTGAYLESSNPGNVAFYEGHGFAVTDVIRPGGAPPLTLMWRDPRSPDPS